MHTVWSWQGGGQSWDYVMLHLTSQSHLSCWWVRHAFSSPVQSCRNRSCTPGPSRPPPESSAGQPTRSPQSQRDETEQSPLETVKERDREGRGGSSESLTRVLRHTFTHLKVSPFVFAIYFGCCDWFNLCLSSINKTDFKSNFSVLHIA